MNTKTDSITLQCPCGENNLTKSFKYREPPEGETRFNLQGKEYLRQYHQCSICKHWFGTILINQVYLYHGEYTRANYQHKIEERFERIVNLPLEKSDNKVRVERIVKFTGEHQGSSQRRTLLDVGSGLGVFPWEMRKKGWDVTALEPDPTSTKFISEKLGIQTINSDLASIELSKKFNLVTYNKVLEHVENPVKLLEKIRSNLFDDSVVYLELPDGEMASKEGQNREEFFIDHLHVFSMKSMIQLCENSGFFVKMAGRIFEPSTKYTLFAFMIKAT